MGKISLILAALLIMIGVLIINPAAAGTVTDRQVNQQERIYNGVANGELTKGEVIRLEKEQRHIQVVKQRSWSDGHLNPKERLKIHNIQDNSNRHIYRLKHNHKKR